MEKIIILSNLGSTSKKYSIYKGEMELAWFHIEKSGEQFVCSSKIATSFEKKNVTEQVYQLALQFVVEKLIEEKIIKLKEDVSVLSIRTVIPSIEFQNDMLCTDEVFEKIKSVVPTDPIHIMPVVDEITLAREYFGSLEHMYLISDSAFHSTYNKLLPIPFAQKKYTIGYHGLACQSVLSVLKKNKIEYSKLVIAHLGGGSSVTGVVNEKSVFNSMQFSPLGGMIMSSRTGSIDPLLLIEYIKEQNKPLDEVLHDLYARSGLLALSGVSSDLRLVREQALGGNSEAKQAIMLFVDSIVETIMRAVSYTQGVDTLVFSGTIGLRALYIRELVCEKLLWMGVQINHERNTDGVDECLEISSFASKVQIYVVNIDEMKEMFARTQFILEKKKK